VTQLSLSYKAPAVVGTDLPELPSLAGISKLGFDTETTVEPRLEDRKLVGFSYYLPDRRKGYVPMRHPGGGNYPIEVAIRWLNTELRGKQLIVANAKHEVHTLLNTGFVNPETLSVSWRDVFHQAGLLNDNRRTTMECPTCGNIFTAGLFCMCGSQQPGRSIGRVNMDVLAREELGIKKIQKPHKFIHEMEVAEAAEIGIEDAELAWLLNQAYTPKIQCEDLTNVLNLEDALVYCTTAMERNGAYLDIPKLRLWNREVGEEMSHRVARIHQLTGVKVDPDSWKGMQKLFEHLQLDYPRTAPTDAHPQGCPSFPEDYLSGVDHPVVQLALEFRQMSSLKSKYLEKYLNAVRNDGRITYELHQLQGDEHGTITGRFACSGARGLGANIQQVSKKDKQPALIQRWDVRELYIPPPGEDWASADASQIEYRIFAHYAHARGWRRIAEAYQRDPWTDFHNFVVEITGLIRDHAKNVNFCKLYGGGVDKITLMINTVNKMKKKPLISIQEGEEIVDKYDAEFPEARRLIQLASDQAENTGFVRTFHGRRRRFVDSNSRFYSALNAVFQGTAGDILKLKLLETYNNRKRLQLTMRFPVHDEIDGSLPQDPDLLGKWDELLNEQTTPLHVPIMWESGTGRNWSEAH